jgi:hypothetical protein
MCLYAMRTTLLSTNKLPILALLPILLTSAAAAPPLSFVSVEARFAEATDAYRRLWEDEGDRIIAALEATTGLDFPDAPIEMIVTGGPPMTAYDGRTIRLRAGYSPDYRKATLVHEMGHRLALVLPATELDDHRLLYLFLYDVWTDLYGRDFADRMVRIERRIPGPGDYDAAWSWALAMTREERQARLQALAHETLPCAEAAAARTPPPTAPSCCPIRPRSCA